MQVSAWFVVVMWLATIRTNAGVGAAELGSCGAQGTSQTNALPVLKGKIHTLGKDPWPTIDPFLFCAYHLDDFPAALPGTLGPAPRELRGRQIGSDFSRRDGWSMYHGDQVPGFPAHPHRGFETVTIVPKGLVDHFDSMGATGRYGNGDVQWLTTGDGVQHSEMFPLVNDTAGNPLELFQLWLNLPRKSKKAKPYFAMLWSEDMPHFEDITRFPGATVKVVAGAFRTTKPLPPPPDSWAADEGNDVAIWLLYLRGKGSFIDVPAAKAALSRRMLYVVRTSQGVQVSVAAQSSTEGCAPMDTLNFHSAWRGAEVESQNELRVTLHRGDEESEAVLLVLQGVPINEPVAQHGPFVLNTQAELQQTFEDYRRTQFGGWPWPSDSHCHPKEQHRFAKRSKSAIPEAPPS